MINSESNLFLRTGDGYLNYNIDQPKFTFKSIGSLNHCAEKGFYFQVNG